MKETKYITITSHEFYVSRACMIFKHVFITMNTSAEASKSAKRSTPIVNWTEFCGLMNYGYIFLATNTTEFWFFSMYGMYGHSMK